MSSIARSGRSMQVLLKIGIAIPDIGSGYTNYTLATFPTVLLNAAIIISLL